MSSLSRGPSTWFAGTAPFHTSCLGLIMNSVLFYSQKCPIWGDHFIGLPCDRGGSVQSRFRDFVLVCTAVVCLAPIQEPHPRAYAFYCPLPHLELA